MGAWVDQRWQELWDGAPPAPPPYWYDGRNVVRIKNFRPGALLAHAMVEARLFKSVGEAKRNGWARPLEPGLYVVGLKPLGVVAR